MVIEHVILPVTGPDKTAFLRAFVEARPLIEASPGFLGLLLQSSLTDEDGMLMLVQWESVAAHQDGFRTSERYEQWRELLHPFYAELPRVTYFRAEQC